MRKYFIAGCAYLLIFCIPLHLSASVSGGCMAVAAASPGAEAGVSGLEGSGQMEGPFGLFGPGKSRRKHHKAKVKRMGNHQNLADKIATRGVFSSGKKKDGAAKNALFMIVPAIAVAGLAVLFATGTKEKNNTPAPDPDDTN